MVKPAHGILLPNSFGRVKSIGLLLVQECSPYLYPHAVQHFLCMALARWFSFSPELLPCVPQIPDPPHFQRMNTTPISQRKTRLQMGNPSNSWHQTPNVLAPGWSFPPSLFSMGEIVSLCLGWFFHSTSGCHPLLPSLVPFFSQLFGQTFWVTESLCNWQLLNTPMTFLFCELYVHIEHISNWNREFKKLLIYLKK